MPSVLSHSPASSPAADSLHSNYCFLTPNRIQWISSNLKKYMVDEKPYLNQHYGIRDLADAVGIPSYLLSAYLNQELDMTFSDFFNLFRVNYCKEFMQNGAAWAFNLAGLARACGFSNRNTLTTAFKKFTGTTPSQYQKSKAARTVFDTEDRLRTFFSKSW